MPVFAQGAATLYVQESEPNGPPFGAIWYQPSSGLLKVVETVSPLVWGDVGGGGGVSDGDKGDITVTASGATWTINAGVVTTGKLGGDVTAAGKALLDDADASAQRTTLGVGTSDIPVFALPIGSVGLGALDTGADHVLTIKSGENLTAGRDLSIVVNDAARTLTLPGNATVSGMNTGDQTTITGNAGSATVLQTARTINGVSFNGSANITVTAAGSTLSDNIPVSKLNSGTGASATTFWRGDATWATPAGGSGDTVLVLAGDVSTAADTNLVNLTGVAFTADAAGIYKIEIWGDTQAAAATTGFGIGINCAQTPVKVALTGYSQLANTGTTTAWSAIANNAIIGVTSGRPSTNTITPTHGGGLLVAHATVAGTCTFRLRSEVAAVVTMKSNSLFIVRKVN